MRHIYIGLLLLLCGKNLVALEPGINIKVCGDDGEWPPYEYLERYYGNKTNKVVGFNIDILNAIFLKHGISYEVTMIPWKRCLYEVKSGRHYSMLLPTSLNEDRKSSLFITRYNYSLTPSYYYLKRKFPKGVSIINPEDLLAYGKVCGRMGYNYKNFGLKNNNLYREALTYKAAFSMLKSERCDIFLARNEIISGFPLIGGEQLVTADIDYAPIPNIDNEKFYFMLSKNNRNSKDLIKIINKELDQLENQGKLKKMLNRYFINLEQSND